MFQLFQYDIALIKIETPFKRFEGGRKVIPICLLGDSKIKVIDDLHFNQEITIIGMGDTNKKEKKPLKLQYATVTRIPDKKCFKKSYPKVSDSRWLEPKSLLIFETFRGVKNSGFCVKVNSILKSHSHVTVTGKKLVILTAQSSSIPLLKNAFNIFFHSDAKYMYFVASTGVGRLVRCIIPTLSHTLKPNKVYLLS